MELVNEVYKIVDILSNQSLAAGSSDPTGGCKYNGSLLLACTSTRLTKRQYNVLLSIYGEIKNGTYDISKLLTKSF